MKGYVAKKGNRWYAVIYEGIDPVTGRERRRWHAAGTERADAERLAAHLASDLEGRNDEVRGLTFGAFLTTRWLPGKRITLAATTFNGTAATSSDTSCRRSAASGSAVCGLITSKRSTTGCSIRRTDPRPWHPRPCTRSTS